MNPAFEVFNAKVTVIVQLLQQGEQQYDIRAALDPASFCDYLSGIQLLLRELKEYAHQSGIAARTKGVIEALEERLAKLASIPISDMTAYAQNLLNFPNLCVADGKWVFDAQQKPIGLSNFVVIDNAEHVLFHQPMNQHHEQMTQVWADLRAAVSGKYVLCFDLIVTQAQLIIAAGLHQFEVPMLVGGFLADILAAYTSDPSRELAPGFPLNLAPLGRQAYVSEFFPPEQEPLDRALSMLRIIQAIAEGLPI